MDASRVTFGAGALHEVGPRLAAYASGRVALFTDAHLRALEWFDDVLTSLTAAGFEVHIFDAVSIEPTDVSIARAIAFAQELQPNAFVSLGGGSTIDTAKLANLVTSHPAALMDYVNAPLGGGVPVPGPLAPHIACPTTSGTGSEVTGIAIFDILELKAKSGVASVHLRPTEALVDPRVTATLPAEVVAASGLDVLCHALESFTARPFSVRQPPSPVTARPMSQGANPWSDIGCRETIALVGRHLRPAVAGDEASRHHMMWSATLAGIAFGNAGVHVPHAMAYAVGSREHVPHGFAVAVNAPAAFRLLAETSPERHAEAAALLGGDAALDLAIAGLMRDIGAPNGVMGAGYDRTDLADLVAAAAPQRRLLDNAPAPVAAPELERLFDDAMRCWDE